MKDSRITLLRHAKSESFSKSGQDEERRLNGKGRSDAALMGRTCSERIPSPDLVVVSPARRARETVDLFLEAWGISQVRVQIENNLYLASLEDWLRIIEQYTEGRTHVLFCGHQPGIGDVSARLQGIADASMPTTAVVSLTHPFDTVDFMGSPREYRT